MVCYLCSRKFSPDAIEEHEVKCKRSWREQNQKLPLRLQQPEPIKSHARQSSGAGVYF